MAQFLAKTGECEVIGLTRNPDGAKAKGRPHQIGVGNGLTRL